MIMDNRGEVVWFKPLNTRGVTDFRVQHYLGKPVLTWWRGHVSNMGVGDGWYVIYNTSYRPVAEVRPGNGLVGDVHEFLITKNNTAVFTVYHRLPVDLSAVGGPKKGTIWDGIVQEVDIKTGRVLFEWHSYPQVAVEASYAPPPAAKAGAKAPPYDYFHINSIAVEPNGNFLVSARNTHTVYEIDRRDEEGAVAARRQEERLQDGEGHELRMAARCPPPGERHDHDLRQRRRTARGEILANPRPAREPADEAGDARACLPPSEETAGAVRGQCAVPAEREHLRRLGCRAVRQRARPERQAALRRVLRSRQAAGRGRRHVSRLPLRLARTPNGPARSSWSRTTPPMQAGTVRRKW